jgi:pimeloyl-ACP methyl ester carboxylesterase
MQSVIQAPLPDQPPAVATSAAAARAELPVIFSATTSADGTTIAYETVGSGDGVIVVGGVLRSASDYMAIARVLAASFTVHVMDRRGRGASGPQGRDYSIDRECEDLLAVQVSTGAERVFGHSYGGFVTLETARRTNRLRRIAVYEPGLSIDGSLPCGWMPRYRELLAEGDTRGAFAAMVKGMGFAPPPLTMMPLVCVRQILRLGIRGQEWRQMESLLEANLREHQEQLRLDDGTVNRYRDVGAEVLICAGTRSPSFVTSVPPALHAAIPSSEIAILDRLDHTAPEKEPAVLARSISDFLR